MNEPRTVEEWIAAYRSQGADPESLRDALTGYNSLTGAQAEAARQFIAQHEQASLERHLAVAHAEQRPALEQQDRHQREQLAESRRQSGRAVAVAWASFAVALLALIISWLSWRATQGQPTSSAPSLVKQLPATPPASTPTTPAPALSVPPATAPAPTAAPKAP